MADEIRRQLLQGKGAQAREPGGNPGLRLFHWVMGMSGPGEEEPFRQVSCCSSSIRRQRRQSSRGRQAFRAPCRRDRPVFRDRQSPVRGRRGHHCSRSNSRCGSLRGRRGGARRRRYHFPVPHRRGRSRPGLHRRDLRGRACRDGSWYGSSRDSNSSSGI